MIKTAFIPILLLFISACTMPQQTRSIRQKIGKNLASIHRDYARYVEDTVNTSLKEIAFPWLKRHKIYEVYYFNPSKPIVFFTSYDEGSGKGYFLSGSPENLNRLAKEEEVQINGEEQAVLYLKAFLDISRSMNEIFYVVEKPEQVRFRPNITGAEEKVRDSFAEYWEREYPTAPVKSLAKGYEVRLWVIRGMALESRTYSVSPSGQVGLLHKEVLREDLPLVYGV